MWIFNLKILGKNERKSRLNYFSHVVAILEKMIEAHCSSNIIVSAGGKVFRKHWVSRQKKIKYAL